MRRIALAMVLLASVSASAQLPQQGRIGGIGQTPTPVVSPYINLLRGGNSTLLNYYGLVRPELNFAQSLQGVAAQANANTYAINNFDPNAVPTTGSAVRFMNTGSYFTGLNRAGGTFGQQAQGVVNTRYAPASGLGGINSGTPFGVSGLLGGRPAIGP